MNLATIKSHAQQLQVAKTKIRERKRENLTSEETWTGCAACVWTEYSIVEEGGTEELAPLRTKRKWILATLLESILIILLPRMLWVQFILLLIAQKGSGIITFFFFTLRQTQANLKTHTTSLCHLLIPVSKSDVFLSPHFLIPPKEGFVGSWQ